MPSDVGLVRETALWITKETTPGVLADAVDADCIMVSGNPKVEQELPTKDSEEIINSPNIIDQILEAANPAKHSFDTYLRCSGTLLTAPQGGVMLESLLGKKADAFTAKVTTGIDDAVTSLTYKELSGELPDVGAIGIGTEVMFYSSVTRLTATTGTFTLTRLNGDSGRGYATTTAAAHLADAAISSKCIFYKQSLDTSPSFTITTKEGLITKWCTGATCNNLKQTLGKKDFVKQSWAGEGMKVIYAGTDVPSVEATSGSDVITMTNADKFDVGVKIWNKTKDDYATTGYTVTAKDGNDLTVTPVLVETWEVTDVIEGYVPGIAQIGTPIPGRHNRASIDGTPAKIQESSINFDCKKQYLDKEITESGFPESWVDGMHKIDFDQKFYQRADQTAWFKQARDGDEKKAVFSFGDTDKSRMLIIVPRYKMSNPTSDKDGEAYVLSTKATALGKIADTNKGVVAGEDAVQVVFC